MSADNMIYIQKRGKKWWVWMGFASDERKPKPKETDVSFSSYPEAHAYAQGWYYGEWVVEYGIVELDLRQKGEIKRIKFLKKYSYAMYLGVMFGLLTGYHCLNSWQWWAIIVPVIFLVAWKIFD